MYLLKNLLQLECEGSPVKLNSISSPIFSSRFSLPKQLMSDIKFCAYDCCFTAFKANSSKDVGTGRFFMMKFIFELANILLVECMVLIFIF